MNNIGMRSGSHAGEYKDGCQLGCDAMYSGRKLTNVLEEMAAFIFMVAGS
jgi:hypothetical protein